MSATKQRPRSAKPVPAPAPAFRLPMSMASLMSAALRLSQLRGGAVPIGDIAFFMLAGAEWRDDALAHEERLMRRDAEVTR